MIVRILLISCSFLSCFLVVVGFFLNQKVTTEGMLTFVLCVSHLWLKTFCPSPWFFARNVLIPCLSATALLDIISRTLKQSIRFASIVSTALLISHEIIIYSVSSPRSKLLCQGWFYAWCNISHECLIMFPNTENRSWGTKRSRVF